MAIAREAWLPLSVASIVAGLAYVLCGYDCSMPLVILVLALLYLFRDPNRRIPPVPLGVVSPVDGRVVTVSEVSDPFLGRESIKITIRMNVSGPLVIRSCMEGQVMQQWYLPQGLDPHLLAGMKQDNLAGEPYARQAHFAMWIQSDEQDDVVIAMRGIYISRRLRCSVQTGERIGQGRRFGVLLFFATADVYVPVNSRIEARQGGTVLAGSDIIANLVHKEQPAAAPETDNCA
jgi:phosphatidylserine decarboxylase